MITMKKKHNTYIHVEVYAYGYVHVCVSTHMRT